ncbi:MAG TPA: beta-propeller fold lactonase family protein, partial [Candidatus Acidoferrum sp.]|nr:beta-propeller fold lactonase family protein [Candidatus Acidoferrum sp.]
MLKRAAALLLICAGVVGGVACSNSSSSHYLYGALPGSGAGEIIEFREDPDSGALTQLANSPITAGSAVQSLALHPSGKFLYAANSGSGNVSLFTISSTTGSLDEVTPRTDAGTAPTLLAMDPAGAFLYVANSGSFNITIFSIDSSTGALTQVGTAFQIGVSALNMQLSPSGNVLYVTAAGNPGTIQAFALTQGVPTNAIAGSPFTTGSNPFGLAIDPAGKFLYTANRL